MVGATLALHRAVQYLDKYGDQEITQICSLIADALLPIITSTGDRGPELARSLSRVQFRLGTPAGSSAHSLAREMSKNGAEAGPTRQSPTGSDGDARRVSMRSR